MTAQRIQEAKNRGRCNCAADHCSETPGAPSSADTTASFTILLLWAPNISMVACYMAGLANRFLSAAIALPNSSQSPCCIACWALAKRDGKTRPTVVMAENNLQFAANLLDEPEDEFHPEPSLKSGG